MTYDIQLIGSIGFPYNSAWLANELEAHADKSEIHMLVSSLGGNVNEGLLMRKLLKEQGNVIAHIEGMTASAATLVALGCKEVRMGDTALFLAHKSSQFVDTFQYFNTDELDALIADLLQNKQTLDNIDSIIASIYAGKSGLEQSKVLELMKAAEWLTAEKCAELGLIDAVDADAKPIDVENKMPLLVACGYPLPDARQAEAKSSSFIDKILAAINRGFNQAQTFNTMEIKNFATLASVVGADTLAPENLESIEQKFSADAAEIEKLNARVAELEAENAALQKADGAETSTVEGEASAEPLNYLANAKKDLDALSAIL